MIKKYFFPDIDKTVHRMLDDDSIRNIAVISPIIAFFEMLALIIYLPTRKSFGPEEWVSTASVLFCIAICVSGFFIARHFRKVSFSHLHVMIFKAVYFTLLSIWAVWASCRQYGRGEQMLTFYAVELILVCFVILRPWLSALLTIGVYIVLFVSLYLTDRADGINILNYAVLAAVSVIGMAVRYHSSVRKAEAAVSLKETKDNEIRDKMNILQAIGDIYDNVNLIDFTDNTEMSVRDKDHVKVKIDLGPQTHTAMSRRIRGQVMPDQLERFIEYTDITTVRSRLAGKRLLSDDFIDVTKGWFRAQYIPVDFDEEGHPLRIIFTTRHVDEEKKREESLIRIAMTDELTRLFNRRSYEEDLKEYSEHLPEKDFVLLSADVNGLKQVNDTLGHAAGDELIKGAADCLLLAIGQKGKVYRTGGDEFIVILQNADYENRFPLLEQLNQMVEENISTEGVVISAGMAELTPEDDYVEDVFKRADHLMYVRKQQLKEMGARMRT